MRTSHRPARPSGRLVFQRLVFEAVTKDQLIALRFSVADANVDAVLVMVCTSGVGDEALDVMAGSFGG